MQPVSFNQLKKIRNWELLEKIKIINKSTGEVGKVKLSGFSFFPLQDGVPSKRSLDLTASGQGKVIEIKPKGAIPGNDKIIEYNVDQLGMASKILSSQFEKVEVLEITFPLVSTTKMEMPSLKTGFIATIKNMMDFIDIGIAQKVNILVPDRNYQELLKLFNEVKKRQRP